MIKELRIDVILNADVAKTEAKELFNLLSGKTKTGGGGKSTIQSEAVRKEVEDTKKYLLDEQRNAMQSSEGWDRRTASIREATIAQRQLMSELNTARSVRTTPYQFTPIDPKQLVTIKAMGINLGVLRQEYQMTESEIKQLISVYQQLSKAVAASNQAMVSTRIKDIRAGVIVKGQGEQLGAGYVSEQTVRDMDALLKKYPQLQGQIQATGVNLDQYHSKFSKLVESTKNYIKFQVGWFLGAGTIFAVVGAVISAAKEVVVFDQSLRDLQAVTGATSEEVNILADTAKRVSKETPLAASEVVKLGLQLMRAGLDIEATTGAMEAAAKVATISGEDLKTVADTMASVFMIWKLGAEDATRAGTVLAAALNYSKLNIEDFGTALNYVGGMAATMGISLEETAGVLASISNLGVRASTMATGWRSFVQEMAAPADKLGKLLSKLGADFDKLNVTKIEGPHKMATVLAELERVGYGTQAALSSLEKRTLAFFLAIKTVGVPALLTMEEKMSDQRAYTEGLDFAMQGLSNQVKNFKNHIFLAALNIGQVLLPALKVLVSVFTTLANVLVHSISFFTSFPGVILPIVATFGILVTVLKDLLIVQKSVIVSLAITAWQQSIIIIKSFAAALMSAATNLAIAGKELRNLWLIMAKNPLGLLLLVITAIVGSAFIDWLIKGQSEFEKLGNKADKLTKSTEEMKKKGEELRKQYPELFQAMAEGAEGAADAMTLYKKRIDEALNVPTFKAPELPNNIKEWIDENLVPSIGEIKEFREELDRLQKQIHKLSTEPIKVTAFDVIGAILKTWINMFGFLPNNIKWLKEIWTDFVDWLGKSVKTILNILGEIPFLGGLKEAAKNVDNFMASLKALPGKIITYPKNVWTEFIEEIRKSKTPEAKKQLEEFTKDYKKTTELSKFADSEFKRIVAEGNFSKMLEQIITATKKLTSEERKKIAFENLTKMIADIASADPDRLKAVLLGMAEAYLKAAAQFDKADKGIGKEIASQLALRLKLESEIYKQRLQQMKLMQSQELKELEHQNTMKELAEKAFTTQLQAIIEERTWMMETFYKEGISDAKDYYDEKQKLLEMSFANEIKTIQAGIERDRSELEKQQDNLIKQGIFTSEFIIKKREEILKLAGTKGLSLLDIIIGESEGLDSATEAAIDKIVATLPKEFRNLIKQQIKEYDSLLYTVGKVAAGYTDLQYKGEILAEQGIQKVTEATIKHTEAMRKQNYETQIGLALEPYEKQKFINEQQSEYNKLMVETNEIAGNWTEAEVYKLKLLENETTLAQLTIDSTIAKTKAEITYMEAMLEARGICDEYYESEKKRIEALKESLPLYEEISKATAENTAVKKAEQELKMADSIGYAIKKVNDEWADHAKYVRELTDNLYRDAAKSFSDIFFDGITGKLKSLKDYFKNIFDSILRYFTDMLGRMVAQNLMGSIMGTTQWMAGGINITQYVGAAGGLTAQQARASGATQQGGLLGAGGILPGISPYILPALGTYMLGNIAGGGNKYSGLTGIAGGYTGYVIGMLASGMGVLGSIVPIIGTIIGAVLGGLLGSLFGGGKKTTPQMMMSYGWEYGEKHAEPTGAYGDSRWQTTVKEGTDVYAFWTKKLGDAAKGFGEDAIKVFKTIRENTKSTFEELGLAVSGFDKKWSKWIDGLEKMTAEQQQAAFKDMVAEYITFAGEGQIEFEKFRKAGESLLDTIDRILTTLTSFPKVLDSFQDYIDAVKNSKDDYAKYKDEIRKSDENLADLYKKLQEATDPTDAEQYAVALKTAIYERYQFEKNLIEGLVATIAQIGVQIRQLEMAGFSFVLGLQQKIDSLKGTFDTSKLIESNVGNLINIYNAAGTPQERLDIINYGVGLVDTWLSGREAEITAKYQRMAQQANASAQASSNAAKDAIQREVEAQQKQLQIIQGWKSLLDNIKTTILKLTTSAASPADVLERLAIQQQAVAQTIGLYQGATGEDKLKYAGDLSQMLQQDYLTLGQEAYQRPSPEYRALFDSVIKDLQMIQGDAEGYALLETDILKEIANLQSQANSISSSVGSASISYQSQMDAELKGVRLEAAGYYEFLKAEGEKQYDAAIAEAEKAKTDNEILLREIIGNPLITANEHLVNLENICIQGLGLVANTFKSVMGGIFLNLDFSNLPQFQSGGYVSKPTLAWVGEKEPEWIIPQSKMQTQTGNTTKNITVNISLPPITINASGDAKPTEIAKEINKELVYAVRYDGKLREEIQNLVKYG